MDSKVKKKKQEKVNTELLSVPLNCCQGLNGHQGRRGGARAGETHAETGGWWWV